MIDAPYLKAHRNGREKEGRGRLIGRTKGGMNHCLSGYFRRKCPERNQTSRDLRQLGPTTRHVCHRWSPSRQIALPSPVGQWVSDYIGARTLQSSLPDDDCWLGDRGYDADWFRKALKDKGIRACIPGRKPRKTTVKYDERRYKRRNRIEIMFGRLKDWRRVATR